MIEWWNGGMYSMVGRRNNTMSLRMRTGMNSRTDEILMAFLDFLFFIFYILFYILFLYHIFIVKVQEIT